PSAILSPRSLEFLYRHSQTFTPGNRRSPAEMVASSGYIDLKIADQAICLLRAPSNACEKCKDGRGDRNASRPTSLQDHQFAQKRVGRKIRSVADKKSSAGRSRMIDGPDDQVAEIADINEGP